MAAAIPKKVAIIIASTRPVRIGPEVVGIIHNILKSSDISPAPELSILDVADFNLPVFNERIMPAMVPAYGQFEHEHSKAWSAAVGAFDGYVLVSPEYNLGIPGSVKNAIDYLYNEWLGKPVAIVTYGIHGANLASAALEKTLSGMKLRVVDTRPALEFRGDGNAEVMLAGGQGVLGPVTRKFWEETAGESLLKAYAELIALLDAPAPEPAKAA